MVTYFKYLSFMINVRTFLVCAMLYFIAIGVTNIGLMKAKRQKIRNWMIVIRCVAASLLIFMGLYVALMVGAGRFSELITAIGDNPAIPFWFIFSYISGKFYEKSCHSGMKSRI